MSHRFDLPLRAVPREELEISGQRVIENREGDEVAYVTFDEDADFIAQACNAHGALLEYFKASTGYTNTVGHEDATVEDEHKAEARFDAATQAAHAAVNSFCTAPAPRHADMHPALAAPYGQAAEQMKAQAMAAADALLTTAGLPSYSHLVATVELMVTE